MVQSCDSIASGIIVRVTWFVFLKRGGTFFGARSLHRGLYLYATTRRSRLLKVAKATQFSCHQTLKNVG